MLYETPFQHLRVRQVANVYGVSFSTIWRWLKEIELQNQLKFNSLKDGLVLR